MSVKQEAYCWLNPWTSLHFYFLQFNQSVNQ